MYKSTMLRAMFCGAFVGLVVLTIGVGASSSEQYIGNAVNKDYPGMCYYNDTQTAIPVNSIYQPEGKCVEIFCRDDFVLRLLYCSRYMVGDGCVVTHHPGLKYPECCPTIDCPTN